MAVNTCTPQSVYGPFEHTLFLGLTVLDFSATAGWNEQYSSLTVKLVQDTCGGDRQHLNTSFNFVTTNFPDGDPGFNGVVGQSAVFKVADFEFAGIIQSITETKGSDGNPIINVSLIAPGVVLEGTQVIIDGYAGTVSSLPNVVNLFAFLESQNLNCPAIGGFGSPAGGFGFARRTDRGIPWLLAKPGLQVLLGGTGDALYSPFGGMKWKGGSSGYGLIGSDLYVLDISELPGVSGINYRLAGPNATILEIISTICRDSGFDFYVDLLPSKGGPGGIITNVIKIRTISRRNQPALGAIQNFVDSRDDIISNSVGQEMRTENNSAFIVGGQKRQVYSTYDTIPFWGFNDDGSPNSASFTDGQWVINIDTRALNLSLNFPIGSNITITESTLLAAQGDVDTFRNWVIASAPDSDVGQYLKNIQVNFPTQRLNDNMGTAAGSNPIESKVVGGFAYLDPTAGAAQDLETLFNFLNSYASDVYGKKFLVRVPWVCVATDSDTGEYLWSDLPSTEGGWYESTPLLGMTYPSSYTNFFADEQGKIQPILQFASGSGINMEEVNNDDYVTNGAFAWVKADISDDWVIYGGNAYALLSLNTPILIKRDEVEDAYRVTKLGPNFRSSVPVSELGTKVSKSMDTSDVVGTVGNPFVAPVAAAVPILSNTQTYGPWIAAATANGTVYFEKDDGLVPWEYGGTNFMNLAATAKITDSVSEMQTSERGSVTMPGYPTVGLGTSIDTTVSSVVSRTVNTIAAQGGNFYVTSQSGTETSSAQISNINVTVGPQGVTTQVDVSTFTPVFGRFTRGNAERLKQIGQLRYKSYRQVDAAIQSAVRLATGAGRGKFKPKAIYNTASAHRSSAMILLGKKYSPNSPGVNIPTNTQITQFDDYDQSSMMTMDGMFRPVQKNAGSATGLAKEVNEPTPPIYQPNYTFRPVPPLNEYTGLPISTRYLDFLSNPYSGAAERVSSSGEGHDIQGVARSNKVALSGSSGVFSIPKARDTSVVTSGVGYTDDYRYLAVRGPLVVHGWGYDIAGKPVPNEFELGTGLGGVAQSGNINGNFKQNYIGLSDQFYNGFLQDDNQWPVAPVDLRYDRKRGVWTVPPAFKILYVENDCLIPAGTSKNVNVLNNADSYDSSGQDIVSGTILLTNITNVDICPGNLMAQYDEENDQYWPLFPGEDCDGCACQSCTYIAVTGTGGGYTEWEDQGGCCDGFKCSEPTGTPSGEGDIYTGECVTCSGNECVYSGVSGTGAGDFIWSSSSSGCCEDFTCSDPTGTPTGLGDLYYGTCQVCDDSPCSYSGSGGNWVGESGNCNGDCGSGVLKCSEPTGNPSGDGDIQSGNCIPCEEYPCRFVAIEGEGGALSWSETGLGCSGCENESGAFQCVEPEYLPLSGGEVFISVCQPEPPVNTGESCTINEISLNCGLSSGIEVTTTPITFTVSGNGMICTTGPATTVLCDTCCSGEDPPVPTGTPTGQCPYQMCGYTAYCLPPYAPLGPCPQEALYWNNNVPCQNGCSCAFPPYSPTEAQEGFVSDCTDTNGPEDEGGGDGGDGPIITPVFPPTNPDDPPIWEDPDPPTHPTDRDGIPDGAIAYKIASPYTPDNMVVTFPNGMSYTESYAKAKPIDRDNFKPARTLFGTGFFATALSGTGDGGVTGYPNHFEMISNYAVKNPIKQYIYTVTGDCSDTGCSGDACEYTATGTSINDWVLTTSCTGCACDCPYPTSPPFASGSVQSQICSIVTGTGGEYITGVKYETGIQYQYNIPPNALATVAAISGSVYEVVNFVKRYRNTSGDINNIEFYDKVFADASTGVLTITLPSTTATGVRGESWLIKKVDTSANAVIITGAGSDLIDGQTTYTINNAYESINITTTRSGEWYLF